MCWPIIKEEWTQLSGKAINVLFPTTYWCDGKFSSHTLTKITYSKEHNTEENARIQLSSTKPDIKDISTVKI